MAQKTNVYECMFILDSNRYARDPGSVAGQIPEMIEKFGGEILADRLWNEQKLAYPIDGHRKGTYWLTYFRLSGDKLPEFNRACQLNENIVRNLVLKVEPRLVDALVSHASGATRPREEEETEEEEKAQAKRSAAVKTASEKEAEPLGVGAAQVKDHP